MKNSSRRGQQGPLGETVWGWGRLDAAAKEGKQQLTIRRIELHGALASPLRLLACAPFTAQQQVAPMRCITPDHLSGPPVNTHT